MAIGKISGQMLQSDLVRQGVDLAIDSTLVYFDVANRRVGVNNTTPNVELTVSGNLYANYLTGNGRVLTGILGSNVLLGANTAGQLVSNAVTLTNTTTVTTVPTGAFK